MDSRYCGDMRNHNQAEIGETLAQRRRRACAFKSQGPPERRSTISSMMPSGGHQVTPRMRNLSGGSSGSTASGSSTGSNSQLDNQYSTDILQLPLDFTKFNANSSDVPQFQGDSSSPSHRKLDRSLSDSDSDRLGNGSSSHRSVNSSRYKTELCRPFEESGSCKYGDKCQFAHGMHELRNLARHPKYKTELCRTFHTIGFCPYGPRCHFIHGDDSKGEISPKAISNSKGSTGSSSVSGSSSPTLSPSGSEDNSYLNSRSDMSIENRPLTNALSVNTNTINDTEDLHALEQQFSSVLNFNKRNPANSNANGQQLSNRQEVMDIFSSVSFFNPEEMLDNASKQPSSSLSLHKMAKVDNMLSQVDSSSVCWQNTYFIANVSSSDPFHYSPTGSTGSDSGNISDCSGSMESLTSSEQLISNQHFAVLQSLAACSNMGASSSVWS